MYIYIYTYTHTHLAGANQVSDSGGGLVQVLPEKDGGGAAEKLDPARERGLRMEGGGAMGAALGGETVQVLFLLSDTKVYQSQIRARLLGDTKVYQP